jgi:hypothetical protein
MYPIDVPHDTRTLLSKIKEREGCNDSADPVPEVSGVQVSVYLENSVVQDLAQESRGLIGVREVDA